MGKVIKNVVKTVVATLCGLLLGVLVLPLAGGLLVSVPAVQNAIVKRLAARASEALGVKVAIDRVALKLFNHAEIEGFYVEDFGGDTLLYVSRLSAPIEKLGLGKEPLTFGRVKLSGAELWLRKNSADEDMNISRVVDSMTRGPSNPKKKFRMCIKNIEADGITFGLLRRHREEKNEGVDWSRFVMRNIHTGIEDFAIAGDTIRMEILSLGCVERTGWRVDNLSARPLLISRGAVTLADVDIRSRGSVLRVPSIRLVGAEKAWSNFGEFTDSVAMEIAMRSSRVTAELVGTFVPAVAGWGIALDDVALHTRGTVATMAGEVTRARTLGTNFSLDFTSRGLPDFETAHLDARLTGLESAGNDVTEILRSVTGRELPAGIAAVLARLGEISVSGEATGKLNDFSATAAMETGAGRLDAAARVEPGEDGARLDGRVATAGFDLGRVLETEGLGEIAGVFTAAGTFGEGIYGGLRGEITGLEFRGYNYTRLELDARADGRAYEVDLTAKDPALEAEVRASLENGGDVPRYALDLDVERADLAAMNIDRDDSVSVLSGRLKVRMSGRGMDDANGTAELRDAVYRSPRGVVETELATLLARNNAAGKLITLRSEFADGEFRSRTGYRDMMAYLSGFLQRYIPMPGQGRKAAHRLETPDGGDAAAAANYSIVSLNVKNTERLFSALASTAAIAEGSSARFMFNPYTGGFSLSAASGFIELGGVLATDVSLTADNAADSLVVYLSGTDVYSGRGHIPRFELHGGAKGGQRVDVALDGRVWRIAADSVGIDAGRVGFDNLNVFAADNPGQRLNVSGVVSRRAGDTLHVRLNGFDLSPFGGLLARNRKTELKGRATGWLDVAGTTGNPAIDADIEIEGLAVGGRQAPEMRFVSRPEKGGVRWRLVNEDTGEDLVKGTLSSRGEIDAEVRVDSLDGTLLDPLLGGNILDGTRGKGSARLKVGGTLRAPKVNGYIDVPRFETTVAYTRARYSVENARIVVENSVLKLPRTRVNNTLGGEGELAMRIDMSNLRDIRTEIDARTGAMLAFDTGPGDSEAFYGRVFATGTVAIRASRMGTRMDISGRTDAGTQFHLPLNAKSNVSWADFVVFTDRSARPDTTDVLARKRLAYERRLAGGGERNRREKPLELNLTVNVTPAAELHMLIDPNLGQGITGRGEGVIDMRINPASDMFTMTGDYNIASGRFEFSMMDVFNKTFEIAPGSTLRWLGTADDALLGVDASYRVRTSLLPLAAGSGLVSGRSVPVDCIIRLRERLSDPEITFDIALPSAEAEARQIAGNAMNTEELKSMQFLSLLTTGSFATDNSITGQAGGTGMMTTGAVGFDILTNQLNNFLSSDDYDVYFRYRPQDNFTTSQVDMGFSTRLWDDRLQLEIEGNWVDDRAATSMGTEGAANLSGDVSLTWVIDRAGNLRLKVFSQTIDRMNETQGLQESGLGIHYKKDFDSLGDILRRKNHKFAPDSVTVNKTGRRRKNKQ